MTTMTFYRRTDGAVTRVLSGDPVLVILNLTEEEAATDGNHMGYRIDLETGLPLPLLEFDLMISNNLIAGLPPGSSIVIDGDEMIVDDDAVEFEVDSYTETLVVDIYHPLYVPRLGVEVYCEAS